MRDGNGNGNSNGNGNGNGAGHLGWLSAFPAWRLRIRNAAGTRLPLPLGMQSVDRQIARQ